MLKGSLFCLLTLGQEDYFPPDGNSIGGACECERNFECDGDCDGADAVSFKADFSRSQFQSPCLSCEIEEWCVFP